MNLLNDVTGAIGNTPMVNLSGIAKAFKVEGNISLNQSIKIRDSVKKIALNLPLHSSDLLIIENPAELPMKIFISG